jgi:aspartate/methionine/tyrosine aminotransferase
MPRVPALSGSARAIRESIFMRLQGRLARHGDDGVPLHLGDTYLPPPPAACAALTATPSEHRYGAPVGEAPLLEALAGKLRGRNQLAWAAPKNLQVTIGATAALAAAARAVLDPGDEIICPTPHWPLIRGIVTNAGGVPVEVPLSQPLYADPQHDAAALLEPAITPRTVALYVTTPNNPDGKQLTRRHLE